MKQYFKLNRFVIILGIWVLVSCTSNDTEEVETTINVSNDIEFLNQRMTIKDEVINITSKGNARVNEDFELKLKGELEIGRAHV